MPTLLLTSALVFLLIEMGALLLARRAPGFRTLACVLGSLLLLLLAGFFGFGFVATFEGPATAGRLIFQIVYAALGLGALAGAVGVGSGTFRQPSQAFCPTEKRA